MRNTVRHFRNKKLFDFGYDDPNKLELHDGAKAYFLLNHLNSPLRIQFYKPMHDFLTGNDFSGNFDLPPHGVLVLDDHPSKE